MSFLWMAGPAAAANFNDILPGARPMGMGMAYTAVADGPYAMFYNPGGLANSEFTQISASLGRMFSPVGPLAHQTMVYTRPFPLRMGSTVGAAYYYERQMNGGDKDEALFHYSEAFRVPQLFLTRPLKTGVNVKILGVKGSRGNKVGVGLDAGAQLESNFGLKGGVALLNLTPDLGVPNPWLSLGGAYTWRGWLTFASDLRVRRGLTQFFPGIEASFFKGLLMGRLGKGLPLDGISQVAFGCGVNFSPVFVDFAMTVPFNGVTRPGGSYQMSLTYKFGSPPFSGRFVGSAAREAEELKAELSRLEDQKISLQSQIAASQTNKTSLEGQVNALDGRLNSLQGQVRQAERRLQEMTYEVVKPKPPADTQRILRVPEKPKPPPFPRLHRVTAGDTLRSIAQQEYGDPNLWELIYEANPGKIERGLPQEGSELAIPAPKK